MHWLRVSLAESQSGRCRLLCWKLGYGVEAFARRQAGCALRVLGKRPFVCFAPARVNVKHYDYDPIGTWGKMKA